MQTFINFTGTTNIVAGILLFAFWYLYALLLPYLKLDTTLAILVEHPFWVPVNLLGVAGSITSGCSHVSPSHS